MGISLRNVTTHLFVLERLEIALRFWVESVMRNGSSSVVKPLQPVQVAAHDLANMVQYA